MVAHTLTIIVAQSNYNETEVDSVCVHVATFIVNMPNEVTTSVNLTIQGETLKLMVYTLWSQYFYTGPLSMVMGVKRPLPSLKCLHFL